MSSPSTHNSHSFSVMRLDDSSLKVVVSQGDCASLARAHLRMKNAAEVLQWSVESAGGTKPFGFLDDYCRLVIVVKGEGLENGDNTVKLSFFVKTLPRYNENRLRQIHQHGVFRKETMMYYLLLPMLKGDNGPTAWRPKCFLVRNDIVVLQDLSMYNFRHSYPKFSLDLDHVKVALTALARMHASCIIYEKKKNCCMGRVYKDLMFETMANNNQWWRTGEDTALAIAEESEKFGKYTEYHSMVQEKLIDFLRLAWSMVKPSRIYKNVVCHRDTRNHNLMFKYNSTGLPEQCILVDFQRCTYNPPALDFNHLLYQTTSRSFRDQHYEELKRFYRAALVENITKEHLDVNDIIPEQEFDDSTDDLRLCAKILAVMTLPLTQMPPEILAVLSHDSEEFDRTVNGMRKQTVLDLMENNENYRTSLIEAMDELLEELLEVPKK
ncbi:uncharacterized protein LOC113367001 [Ctenocephalides felis]|uniref:uncharacterized protein LOC113367001 n=1 Tax=Ctenocephalides felis TaxID=7515 RepID=UPI000E6E1E33|nr:uncharacterized protein LOC113367001 [Ctenocephalides felis]